MNSNLLLLSDFKIWAEMRQKAQSIEFNKFYEQFEELSGGNEL